MSDDGLTDDEMSEMTSEDEKELKKLKEQTKPLADLTFLLTRTQNYGALLKKDRKRKEAKRKNEKQTSEDPMSQREPAETVSQESNSHPGSTAKNETATSPLHIQLSTELIGAPLQSTSARKIPRSQRVEIYSESRTTWLPVIAFLDTGTSDNWISRRIIERGSFRPRYGETIHYTNFSGVHLPSDGVVVITWCGAGSAKSHEASFRVAGVKAPFDLLFGRDILNSEEASECLTTELVEPNAVLVQLKACNAENLIIEENRTKNDAAAAEIVKQQQQKKLAEKKKSKSASDATNNNLLENGNAIRRD